MSSIISGCCNAFLEYIDCNCICTKCGKKTILIKDGDSLTTSIVYNVQSSSGPGDSNQNQCQSSNAVNMSNDLLNERLHKFKRCAHDMTCALTLVECPICKNKGKISKCRMSRNQAGLKIFVCTNDDCRHTFTY
jgi:hypothetical protein